MNAHPFLAVCLCFSVTGAAASAAPSGPFGLDLPDEAVSDRVSHVKYIEANTRETFATFEGPGCLKHLYVTLNKPITPGVTPMMNRKIIIRIFFDDSKTPHVEAPVGDFFGVQHGVNFYRIDTPLLSVQEWSGYNCYFEMPFAKNARIEFETGGERLPLYLQADWHRYPGQEMRETRRFCAGFRREMPTERYGNDFLMLDADGPGQLIGFVYGVRLIDNTDRWSHGGADNIYIDGHGEHPAYLRGIGGEDVFGTSFGGALHPPESHHYMGMPYYAHEDTGEARVAQRVTGYRFFIPDPVRFRESIHMRFGSMENDICATVYWYQSKPLRPFVKLPEFPALLPGVELKRGAADLPLPETGVWRLHGPGEEEPVTQASDHGFNDFNHAFRPRKKGAGVHHRGVTGRAECVIEAEEDVTATIRLAWDDRATLTVNGGAPMELGDHAAFRSKTVSVPLKKGPNRISLSLTNEQGSNHGGWCFAFKATTPEGKTLIPQASE